MAASLSIEAPVRAPAAEPVRILLVDDQPGRLLTYQAILEPLGERLVQATSGREALRLLEEDNVIVRRHGVGTFVNSKPVFSSGIEELTSVSDMIRQAGMEPGVVYLSTSESICSEEDVNRFHCNPEDTVITIERVRTANGEPVVYCIDKVPSVYLPEGFLGRKESSIFSALEESGDIRISYAVTFIDPTGYHEEASPILECDPETALLVLKQHHYDENDRLVLYSKNYFRADKFRFHVVRKRL